VVYAEELKGALMKESLVYTAIFLLCIALMNFSTCGSSNVGEYSVTVTWDENHERLVNSTGGGYRVYCSRRQGFSVNDQGVLIYDVSYESGSRSPTSTNIVLTSGTWFIKVAAYMDLNDTIMSSPSAEQSVSLP
jgi:hypothetical protein